MRVVFKRRGGRQGPEAKLNGISNLPQFVITAADDPATFRRCESKRIGAKSVLTVVEYGELIGSWPSSSEENGKLAGARIDTAAQLIN